MARRNPPSRFGRPDTALASMGIYILRPPISTSCWKRIAADEQSHHDFGMDVITAGGRGGHRLCPPVQHVLRRLDQAPYPGAMGFGGASFWETGHGSHPVTTPATSRSLAHLDQLLPGTATTPCSSSRIRMASTAPSGINSMFAGGTIVSGALHHVMLACSTTVRVSSARGDQAVIFPGSRSGPAGDGSRRW